MLSESMRHIDTLQRRDSDFECKAFGPEACVFITLHPRTIQSFSTTLCQIEPSMTVINIGMAQKFPGEQILCLAADMGWLGFLFKFVLDYNLTFGGGKHIVRWHGTQAPTVQCTRNSHALTPPPVDFD